MEQRTIDEQTGPIGQEIRPDNSDRRYRADRHRPQVAQNGTYSTVCQPATAKSFQSPGTPFSFSAIGEIDIGTDDKVFDGSRDQDLSRPGKGAYPGGNVNR